jgi:hypothetical protein
MSSLVDTLHRDGIALGHADTLIAPFLLAELETTCASLPPMAASPLKPYLVQGLGRTPEYDAASIFARIAAVLHPIADGYLHAPAALFYYNVWHTLTADAPPSASQLWHGDSEDTSLVKAFYYLTDVTDGAGPLVYIPGTHWRGTRRPTPKTFIEHFGHLRVPRTTDAAMRACVPEAEWRTAIGTPGTLVLADTTGWHKGGYATTRERRVVVWEWVTTQCAYGKRFQEVNPWLEGEKA